MKCPKHKIEMEYIGYFERGFQPRMDSINYYCEYCHKVYFKIFEHDNEDVKLKGD
jgi:hypothetical protein